MPFFEPQSSFIQLKNQLFELYTEKSIKSLMHGGDLTRGLWSILRLLDKKKTKNRDLYELIETAKKNNNWFICAYLSIYLAKKSAEDATKSDLYHQAALQLANLLVAKPEVIRVDSSLEVIILDELKNALQEYVNLDLDKARDEVSSSNNVCELYKIELEKIIRTNYPVAPPPSPHFLHVRRNDPYSTNVLSSSANSSFAALDKSDENEVYQFYPPAYLINPQYVNWLNFVLYNTSSFDLFYSNHHRITEILRNLAFFYPEEVRNLIYNDAFKQANLLFVAEISNLMPSYTMHYLDQETDMMWFNLSALCYSEYAENNYLHNNRLIISAIRKNLTRAYQSSPEEMTSWLSHQEMPLPSVYENQLRYVRSIKKWLQTQKLQYLNSNVEPTEPSPDYASFLKSLW